MGRKCRSPSKRAVSPVGGTVETRKVKLKQRERKEMPDVIQGPKSDAQRITDRMKPSNDTSTANTIVHRGDGPTRIIHSVHRSGSVKIHAQPQIRQIRRKKMKQTRHRWREQQARISQYPHRITKQRFVTGRSGSNRAIPAFRKDQIDAQRGYNASQLGNDVALNSKSAPGQGRTTRPCGSQGTFGPVNPGNSVPARDILSPFGPDIAKADVEPS